MTTPLDIISMALKDAGVTGLGQQATADDVNDAFRKLNWMVAQWAHKRWLVYSNQDKSVVSTGAQKYTVGPGGDISIAVRPDEIQAAFQRQLVTSGGNAVDYPLEILTSYEDYSKIAIKQLQSFATYVFYDKQWPLGNLFVWPIPQSSLYEIHIIIKAPISQFSSISQSIAIPDEYFAALYYNLAVRLMIANQLPINSGIVGMAKDSLNVIRKANVAIPRMSMPTDLQRSGVYNPYSDQIR